MHVASRKAAGKDPSSPRFDVIACVISTRRCDDLDFPKDSISGVTY
jgi:hypothetical protein